MLRTALFSALLLVAGGADTTTNDTGPDDSGTTSADEAPEAGISAPDDGSTWSLGQVITFEGAVSDAEDLAVDLSVVWASDVDGELTDIDGTVDEDGMTSGDATLTEGTHTVSLTVTDSAGNTGTDAITVTISPENEAPTCGFTTPEDGDSGPEGAEVTFEAWAADDGTVTALDASLTSDVDGELWSGSPASDGTFGTTTTSLTLAAHTVTLEVADEYGATCTAEVVYVVGGPPTITISAPTDGEEINEGDWYSFTAVVGDEETPSVDLFVAWESDLDGPFTSSNASAAGIVSPSYGGLTPGDHVVTATVTDNEGLTAADSVALTVNGVPTAPEVSITPDPADADDDLFVVIDVDSTDPEGDEVSYSYEWYRYAVLSTASSSESFPASETSRGVTFTVRVIPSDGKGEGTYGEAQITIGNAAPVVGTVSISPDPAGAEDVLVCSYGGFYDADGDGDYSTMEWLINGVSAGTALNLRGGFVKGDTVTCTVTPSDGTDDGDPVSGDVEIVNTPPEIESATITPEPAWASDTLRCEWSGFYDADGDSDVSTIEWFVNGSSVSTASLLKTGFVKGDEVSCEVTPDDGEETGTAVTATTTIQNAEPSVASVTIDPDPAQVEDTLTCSWSGYSDVDGDADSSRLEWTISGSSAGTDATLSGGYVGGDEVACTVTPNDGEDDGTPVAATLTIDNTAPSIADVTIDPDPADADDTLTCLYAYTDPDGQADASTIEWFVNGSSVATGATLSGAFARSDRVKCEVTASDGEDTGNTESADLQISNGLPTIDSVSIEPLLATATDSLECTYSGFYDPDGDSDSSTIAWDINGTGAGSGSTLSSGYASGDLVTCTVTPHDGREAGPDSSLTIVIDNQAPVIADAAVSPDPATSDDTLTCVPGTTTDPDGTTSFTYSYTWAVNGVTLASSETLAGAFGRDDNVSCTATPNDGQLDGNTVTSAVVTISNGLPVVTDVSFSSSDPATDDSLTATPSATDNDGDSLTYAYTWYVDGSPATETSDTLDGSTWFDKGQQVYVEVVANDGYGDSDSFVSDTLTVVNTAPEAPEVSIDPTSPGEAVHDFQCVIDTDSADADDDSLTYSFTWDVDGVPYTSASTTDHTGDTVLAGEAFEGEVWTCTVTPNDGEEDGTEAEASAEIGPECGEVSSVDSPDNHRSSGSTYGQWMSDPEETLGADKIWYMNSYNGNTIEEYDDMADFEAGKSSSSWALTYDYDGTGAAVYDGYLYYNQANTRNMVKYDLDSQSVVDTVELTNAGYRNTYHYEWGGYSDIDFAVDENGLWVLYATSSNSGKLVVSKLSEDLDIEDTWNTNSESKTNMGNAFVSCGIVYAIDSYSGSSTTINYAYDTSDSSDQSLSISLSNPGGYNSMVDYNYLDQQLWAWDSGQQVTYDVNF